MFCVFQNETASLLEEQKIKYMKSARNYIKAQFIEYGGGNEVPSDPKEKPRQIYVHVTVATDGGNVKKVFNDVQQIVVSRGLQINNLL